MAAFKRGSRRLRAVDACRHLYKGRRPTRPQIAAAGARRARTRAAAVAARARRAEAAVGGCAAARRRKTSIWGVGWRVLSSSELRRAVRGCIRLVQRDL